MNLCIWCKKEVTKNSYEHIIPEALGCPDTFVLNNYEICNTCNNRFGNIDHALINAFDFFAFMSGVPRKKGKSPVISNKGNFYAHYVEGKPVIHINMNKSITTSSKGIKLGKYGKSLRNVKGEFESNEENWKVDLNFQFGDDPKLVRALYKIGLEALVYFLGKDVVSSNGYNTIRDYVLTGRGNRKVILKLTNDLKYRNEVHTPYKKEGVGYGVHIRIAYVEFFIDLTEDQSLLPDLENEFKKHYGEKGWGVFPVKV